MSRRLIEHLCVGPEIAVGHLPAGIDPSLLSRLGQLACLSLLAMIKELPACKNTHTLQPELVSFHTTSRLPPTFPPGPPKKSQIFTRLTLFCHFNRLPFTNKKPRCPLFHALSIRCKLAPGKNSRASSPFLTYFSLLVRTASRFFLAAFRTCFYQNCPGYNRPWRTSSPMNSALF